jgi:hypothetical protein
VVYGGAADWTGYETVVEAGPTLVKESKVDLKPRDEHFRDPDVLGTGERTAVGLTAEKKLLLVTVARAMNPETLMSTSVCLSGHSTGPVVVLTRSAPWVTSPAILPAGGSGFASSARAAPTSAMPNNSRDMSDNWSNRRTGLRRSAGRGEACHRISALLNSRRAESAKASVSLRSSGMA